ncbi:hypothetical protein [Paenibacillus qinlingensis]|uniref:Nucleic acid-binding Zn-ribbon protein n=1 Tax=Paenibacillus qinlingensis TaxID=1837343 RepID=A0ABU1NS33_9BACL|nr:hypothetical protein [Paenibacillus qinlingensis]MDR6550259.1 putative nucleic acid-binding Zn-ribbon protein [Paenibacillus qinlingensis]
MNISIHLNNERTPGRLEVPINIHPSHPPQTLDKHKRDDNKDTLTISPQAHNLYMNHGLKTPQLERLMEQKENMLDRRNDYISSALERGASPEDMKIELEQMDKQMEDLNKQIQQLQHEKLNKATGLSDVNDKENDGVIDKKDTRSDTDSSTTNQLSSETMNALLSTHTEMNQAERVKKAQLTLETEALSWSSDPVRSARLKSKAAELDGKIMDTSQKVMITLNQANEKSSEDIQTPLPTDENGENENPFTNPL